MAFSAPNEAKDQKKGPKQVRWYQDDVGIRTPTGYLDIHHDAKQQRLIFHADGTAITPFKDINELVKVLLSDTHRVFLEWCQVDTGSYVYFNLGKVIQGLDASTNPHISMDVNLLLLAKESASASSSDEKEARERKLRMLPCPLMWTNPVILTNP